MLTALAKDLAGSADICAVVVGDWDRLAVAPYVLPGESLLFAFASPKEEFAFTDEALIRVQGTSAANPRKLVHRFEFRACDVTDVQFEAAGRLDRDCQLRFNIGKEQVEVEIRRKEGARVKRFYQALVALSRAQEGRRREWDRAKATLEGTLTCAKPRVHRGDATSDDSEPGSQESKLTDRATLVMKTLILEYEHHQSRSYKEVLSREIARAV